MNHTCFREEQEISFVATKLTDAPGWTVPVPGMSDPALTAAAVFGGNASGKSSVLNALNFMMFAVVESHRGWKPDGGVPRRRPFALDEAASEAPSEFAVDLVIEDVRYEYGFTLDSERVLEEWLYAYPHGKRQTWFTRDVHGSSEFAFGKLLRGENRRIERLTRNNSLFLSAAAQNNHEQLTPVYNWFDERVAFVHEENYEQQVALTTSCLEDPEIRDDLVEMLSLADLGIVDVALEDEDSGPSEVQLQLEEAVREIPGVSVTPPTGYRVSLLHSTASSRDGVPFPFHWESEGTRRYFGLLGPVLRALGTGGLLCIDELDSSLHPILASRLLVAFMRVAPKTGAQLLFNTHDTTLLSLLELRRDQIWFTEKDGKGEGHLYPLTDFRPRRGIDLAKGYLQGRYGAVPIISGDFLPQSASAGES